jgi:hypothetical protein
VCVTQLGDLYRNLDNMEKRRDELESEAREKECGMEAMTAEFASGVRKSRKRANPEERKEQTEEGERETKKRRTKR